MIRERCHRPMRKDILKRSKILIVDDQKANADLLESVLREQGFIGIQKLTDAHIKEVDEAMKHKEAEILKV